MLLTITVLSTAVAVLIIIAANVGLRHLNEPVTVPPMGHEPAFRRWPWVKIFLTASCLYFAAMYGVSLRYDPTFSIRDIFGRPSSWRAIIQRPFMPLLDSRFAAIAPDPFFRQDADLTNENRSNILLYEDGKPLGPAHSAHYEIAMVGMGRYSHWRGDHSVFVFSSSDNTDPHTNGRTYWAEQPRKR